jgi:acyl carrier protein
MSSEIRAKVRGYLEQQQRKKNGKATFTDSDSLFISGLFDSLDALETISFLEEEYRIDFAAMGFDLTLLDSVDEIVAFVMRLQPAAGARAG